MLGQILEKYTLFWIVALMSNVTVPIDFCVVHWGCENIIILCPKFVMWQFTMFVFVSNCSYTFEDLNSITFLKLSREALVFFHDSFQSP